MPRVPRLFQRFRDVVIRRQGGAGGTASQGAATARFGRVAPWDAKGVPLTIFIGIPELLAADFMGRFETFEISRGWQPPERRGGDHRDTEYANLGRDTHQRNCRWAGLSYHAHVLNLRWGGGAACVEICQHAIG